jgi:hypothetical protein
MESVYRPRSSPRAARSVVPANTKGRGTLSSTGVKRPGVVTFIGVILYIQALMAAVAAIVSIAFSGRLDDVVVNGVALSKNGIIVSGIWEAIMAVILLAVASGIMRGSRGYRMFVAIVEGIRIASSLGFMLFHSGGAYVEAGFVSILISMFVLWALYHEKSDEFFEATG